MGAQYAKTKLQDDGYGITKLTRTYVRVPELCFFSAHTRKQSRAKGSVQHETFACKEGGLQEDRPNISNRGYF